MLLNVTLWFTVTHKFKGNGPKLANWSKWICILLWSCFCNMLTSNSVVSAGCLHYSFIDFTQNNQKIVIGPYIDDIETNLPIEKHTLRVFAWLFQKIGRKSLFRCFIFCVCLSLLHLVVLSTIYTVHCNLVVYCHAYN